MKKIFFLIGFFFLTIPYTLFPIPSFAQQLTLSISPPLLQTIIKPGKSIMIAYTIRNSGDPTIITSNVVSFEAKDNLGNITLKNEIEGPVRFSLDNADIQLGKPFFMKTGDSQQILLRIRIPDGAPEGDYYYTLLGESEPPPTVEGVQTARAKATIGSNILITVTNTGTVDVKGNVALFDVLPRFSFNAFGSIFKVFDSNDKIPLVLIVDNKGSNLITPEGKITLKGNFGEQASYDIIPQNILAQSQRLLTASNSAEFTCPDSGNQPSYCKQPITVLLSGFFIGLYKLSTTISFGEHAPNIFGSTSFIALPFKLIFALLVGIIIAFIIIKRVKKEEN